MESGDAELPRLFVSGPMITVPGGHPIPIYGPDYPALAVRGSDDAKSQIERLISEGVDRIKIAVSGALSAGRKSMDTFGVIVIAFVTATGGGTIRDLLLNRHPVFWIGDRIYLAVILVVALATVVFTRFRRPPRLSLLVADAFGLGLFTIVGTRIAEEAGAPIVIAILMGAITGAAGGVLRDLLCDEIPLILRRDIYATASLVGATIYIILEQVGLPLAVSATIGAATTFLLRLAAIKWNLQVPAFVLNDDDS